MDIMETSRLGLALGDLERWLFFCRRESRPVTFLVSLCRVNLICRYVLDRAYMLKGGDLDLSPRN